THMDLVEDQLASAGSDINGAIGVGEIHGAADRQIPGVGIVGVIEGEVAGGGVLVRDGDWSAGSVGEPRVVGTDDSRIAERRGAVDVERRPAQFRGIGGISVIARDGVSPGSCLVCVVVKPGQVVSAADVSGKDQLVGLVDGADVEAHVSVFGGTQNDGCGDCVYSYSRSRGIDGACAARSRACQCDSGTGQFITD